MALQGERTQSTGTGHAAVLQDLTSSLASSHALPPLLAGVTTYLVQFCWPPPQVRLQVVMGIQGDRAQWTGQWSVVREQGHTLHPLASSLLSWHSWPPLLAGVVMFRLQVCWPPPQGALQLVLGSQGDRMQSTGQPAVLHSVASSYVNHFVLACPASVACRCDNSSDPGLFPSSAGHTACGYRTPGG